MMENNRVKESLVLGLLLCLGLGLAGYILGDSLIRFKGLDRSVTVKGLSERELKADIAIWPIRFIVAENDLSKLYDELETKSTKVTEFLSDAGFDPSEITVNAPVIEDKQAMGYVDREIPFRFSGTEVITVYTKKVDNVISARKNLVTLGKSGIVIAGDDYRSTSEYIFSGLNDIKPQMIEEATKAARQVAEKFARDSQSSLGKIKSARQGQFSITDRDSNTPYIKKIRVVSTIEYYLSD